jgi:glycosyltransferase involved in cell wall biosynthesis
MHKPLRICHISDCLPGTHNIWGGAEQACFRIIEASADIGIDVSVITTKPDTEIMLEKVHFFTVPTLDSYINPNIIRNLSLRHLGFDPVSFIHIYKILKKIKPDIVHIHRTVMLTLSAVKAAQILGIQVIATVYDYFNFCPKETLVNNKGELCCQQNNINCVACMGLTGWSGFLKKPFMYIRKKIFDYLLKDVVFHVLSKSSSNILKTYGINEDRIYKILQIFSIKSCESSSMLKKGLILYVGWIQERKGLHILLEAMPMVFKSCPFAYINAIGVIYQDAYFDKIKKLIKNNNLDEKVSLLGKKDYDEVLAYMKEANVVVIPEQWENMSPVVLVEAMSHGRAVVASSIGGIPEFIIDGENGLLASPSSAEDFARKIIKVLADEDEARNLGGNAREYITRLMDEKRIIEEYKTMYEKIRRQSMSL